MKDVMVSEFSRLAGARLVNVPAAGALFKTDLGTETPGRDRPNLSKTGILFEIDLLWTFVGDEPRAVRGIYLIQV